MPAKRSRIAVVGLGYVGLPTALAFVGDADVVGVDIDPTRLAAIERGAVDLPAALRGELAVACVTGVLQLCSEASAAVTAADAVIVCVPTPIDCHRVPDLRALRQACATVVAAARPGHTLILTSTVQVGATAELLVAPLRARGLEIGTDVFVAFSPERIDPGVASSAVVPRLVGGVTPECTARAIAVLGAIAPTHAVSCPEAAELAKLHENTFRAVNIAYVNELADVAAVYGLDAAEVIDAAATKPYGFMAFRPGPGIGGHCIPCDPHYLLWDLRRQHHRAPLVEAAMNCNAERPAAVVQRLLNELVVVGRSIVDAAVLVCGVTYKPNVDDVRESPALEILAQLERAGARAAFCDARVRTVRGHDGVERHAHPYVANASWDAVVVVHDDALGDDRAWLAAVPVVVDTTYQLAPAGNVARL